MNNNLSFNNKHNKNKSIEPIPTEPTPTDPKKPNRMFNDLARENNQIYHLIILLSVHII